MSNFALFTFEEEDNNCIPKRKIFKYLMNKNEKRRKNRSYENNYKIIELSDNVNICIIKIPCSLKSLEFFNIDEADKLVHNLREKHNINSFILPACASQLPELEDGLINPYTGKFLFRSLTVDLITELYAKSNTTLNNLDIAVIQGENNDYLEICLKQLCPFIKYLTVVSNNKSSIENEINNIYIDSGLCIGVAEDYKNSLNSADIIINLNSLYENLKNYRFNSRSIVINYGNADISRVLHNNFLVNGIEVRLPENICTKLDKNIFNYFNLLEIAEIILRHKVAADIGSIKSSDNYEIAEKMAREFKRDGYNISGIVGRRNITKINDLVIKLHTNKKE